MPSTDPERERRLAEALRSNLRLRKAQAREAAGSGSPRAPTTSEDKQER